MKLPIWDRTWIWKREDGDYEWSEDYVNLVTKNSLVLIGRPILNNEEKLILRTGTQEEVNRILSTYL